MQNFCLSESIFERLKDVEEQVGYSNRAMQVDCNCVDIWEYLDEQVCTSEEIHALGMNLLEQGQCLPVVVIKQSPIFKPKSKSKAQFILLSGVKRWLACKKYDLPLMVMEKDFTFEQAMNLLLYEDKKQQLSDYAKGKFYSGLLDDNKIDAQTLCKKLSITRATLNNYLAFAMVPQSLWQQVGDTSLVSAKTAQTILRLYNKGENYQQALYALADKIQSGFGSKRLTDAVAKYLGQSTEHGDANGFSLNHDGKELLKVKGGKMKLSSELCHHANYAELVEQMSQVIVKFFDNHRK